MYLNSYVVFHFICWKDMLMRNTGTIELKYTVVILAKEIGDSFKCDVVS